MGIILPHVVSRMPRYANNVHINCKFTKLVIIIIMASVCRIVKAGSRLIKARAILRLSTSVGKF